MLLFLPGVFVELGSHRFASNPRSGDRMESVTQNADDLSGHRLVEQRNRGAHVGSVVGGPCTLLEVLSSPFANGFNLGCECSAGRHGRHMERPRNAVNRLPATDGAVPGEVIRHSGGLTPAMRRRSS